MNEQAVVSSEREGDLCILSMNCPPYNLLGPLLIGGIMKAMQEALASGARAILLKSDLKHFSAGADLEVFAVSDGKDGRKTKNPTSPKAFLDFMGSFPLPVIASVRGAVLGGGLEVALACDFIIAARSARIGAVETTLGLAPVMGGVQRMVQRIGLARAKEFAMLGRRHDAETMERIGLINLAVADDDLDEVSLNYAQQLATGPTVALGAIKKIANLMAEKGMETADVEMEGIMKPVLLSNDVKNGIQEFQKFGPGTAVFGGK